uniref:Methylthioribulose-1-phosphate dehydratase n=1 Tax=Candidatus Kentrum sp. FW TaxID=2126338 RepID=A0A450SV36_9GAMM|nr:MAG: methylthioribulose-1-phosphate dehydratase [Candidatus Kentron sp. FW]VFJ57836.1 MAG: methylthioribulose-1-phosphate dehydratase [Candidatus Kentron sp. FW]
MEQETEISFQQGVTDLVMVGRRLHEWGMVPASSGNLSVRLANGDLAITVSGAHKGSLSKADIMRVDAEGRPLDERCPSAETALHVQVYRHFPNARVVLHPHSLNSTLLSCLYSGCVLLKDYELLKAFPGIDTHACEVIVPNFANDQDMVRLASKVAAYMETNAPMYGYLITGHGFYTWGESMDDALRHVEAFDSLFAYELRMRELKGPCIQSPENFTG